MPRLALEFRFHSHFLFGLLQAIAAKDTTAVAESEVRIRVQTTDNQTQKRRSELSVSNRSLIFLRQYSSAVSWPYQIFVPGSPGFSLDDRYKNSAFVQPFPVSGGTRASDLVHAVVQKLLFPDRSHSSTSFDKLPERPGVYFMRYGK